MFCVRFASRRVMELLIQDWSLSAKLRLPAVSRLQKVHNVDMALQVLRSKGVDLKDEHGNSDPPPEQNGKTDTLDPKECLISTKRDSMRFSVSV